MAGHRGEPGAGTARDAVTRPPLGGPRKGILRALLGQVPVTGEANKGGDDLAPLLVERLRNGDLDVGAYMISQIGLTSIEPELAPGSCDAASIASSRSLQSTTK
jgi:hypothetical protein